MGVLTDEHTYVACPNCGEKVKTRRITRGVKGTSEVSIDNSKDSLSEIGTPESARARRASPGPLFADDDTSRSAIADRFRAFWGAWPRKANKKKALQAFEKIAPDEQLLADMLAAIEQQSRSKQWKQGFIPHASTWLNGERWLDEVDPPRGNAAAATAAMRRLAAVDGDGGM